MAIYHCHVKPISRKAGMSAPARAAYCCGEKIRDFRTGVVHERAKGGVEHEEIVLPSQQRGREYAWAMDRELLWNAAEAAERRKDSRVAREYQIGLPHELGYAERVGLVRDFSRSLTDYFDVAVHFAVHEPDAHGDKRNYHAHVLTTTRTLTPNGMGEKAHIELGERDRAKRGLGPAREEIRKLRFHWADLTNGYLKEHGHEARIDARSYAERGIEKEPGRHKGWVICDLERHGKESEVMQRWQEEARERQREKQAQALEREALRREIEAAEQELQRLQREAAQELEAQRQAQEQARLEAQRLEQERQRREAQRRKAKSTPEWFEAMLRTPNLERVRENAKQQARFQQLTGYDAINAWLEEQRTRAVGPEVHHALQEWLEYDRLQGLVRAGKAHELTEEQLRWLHDLQRRMNHQKQQKRTIERDRGKDYGLEL